MKTWSLNELDTQPRAPEIVASNDDARAIVIDLPVGESLDDHEVHERAWLVVVAGEIEVTALESGERAAGGVGMLVEFEPTERHRVDARSDARFLLLLTPWPGPGHPGALSLDEKAQVRERAAERQSSG
ncbi:MAG TPA: cupin domain-containing protein [Solirubrobacterales bacterium]|nr:cupin domain-containing protein [Solirubrobacterales bacterium]